MRRLLAHDESLVDKLTQIERLDAIKADIPVLPVKRKKIGLSEKK